MPPIVLSFCFTDSNNSTAALQISSTMAGATEHEYSLLIKLNTCEITVDCDDIESPPFLSSSKRSPFFSDSKMNSFKRYNSKNQTALY